MKQEKISEAKIPIGHPEKTGVNMVSTGTITDIKGLAHAHIPEFSKSHPLIPKHYIMPWKQDMVNSKLIMKHASLMGLNKSSHEDSLFLENKERLCHGEERQSIREKITIPLEKYTDVPLHSPLSKYPRYVRRHNTETVTTTKSIK